MWVGRICLIFLFMTGCIYGDSHALERFKWQHRIVLALPGASERPVWIDRFESRREGIKDRDVIWFILDRKARLTNYGKSLPEGFNQELIDRYFPNPNSPGKVVLIGKDGGEKLRQNSLDIDELFLRIDAMPMRRAEMREKDS